MASAYLPARYKLTTSSLRRSTSSRRVDGAACRFWRLAGLVDATSALVPQPRSSIVKTATEQPMLHQHRRLFVIPILASPSWAYNVAKGLDHGVGHSMGLCARRKPLRTRGKGHWRPPPSCRVATMAAGVIAAARPSSLPRLRAEWPRGHQAQLYTMSPPPSVTNARNMLESCDHRARRENRKGKRFHHHAAWPNVADAVIEANHCLSQPLACSGSGANPYIVQPRSWR